MGSNSELDSATITSAVTTTLNDNPAVLASGITGADIAPGSVNVSGPIRACILQNPNQDDDFIDICGTDHDGKGSNKIDASEGMSTSFHVAGVLKVKVGEQVEIHGTTVFNSTVDFLGDTNFNGSTSFNGEVDFNEKTFINGELYFDGGRLTVDDDGGLSLSWPEPSPPPAPTAETMYGDDTYSDASVMTGAVRRRRRRPDRRPGRRDRHRRPGRRDRHRHPDRHRADNDDHCR